MRVFVKSFGCSTNLADGAVLAGCLAQAGCELASSISDADVVIYNTCAVKGPTENRMIEILKRVPKSRKLIVAGCLPLINFERLRREARFDGAVGPAMGKRIVGVVSRVLNGEEVLILKASADDKPELTLPRLQVNPVISIVPVNYGCLGSCAYCCVVFARGQLRSYDIQEIDERVREDLATGLREFWITSQDTACFGRDRGTNLAELLNALCSVDGDFRIRVGMMNPNTLMDILEDLIQAFQDERVFKFVHLPVQSGDDRVLERMRRFYSVDDFKRLVDAFRASFPRLTLSTDIICGFPGEDEEASERTLRLVEEIRPDIINVSKFFARPRTPAVRMQKDFLPSSEIKRRSTSTSVLAKRVAYEKNQQWLGWTGDVLIDEIGKVPHSWVGRNFAYKPIIIRDSQGLLGKILQVKVVKAFPTYLEGENF
jgi:MiaB-like tRNA modifying enzyme